MTNTSTTMNTVYPSSSSSLTSCMKKVNPSNINDNTNNEDDTITIRTESSSSLSSIESTTSSLNHHHEEQTKSTQQQNKPRRNVQFTNLEMRFYNRILGDNPACSDGVPISLDWTYNTNHIYNISIDEYEIHRLPRRTRRQLKLSNVSRRNMMVYHFNYTHDDIDVATKKVQKYKKQREKTKAITKNGEKRIEIVQSLMKKMNMSMSFNKRRDWYVYDHDKFKDSLEVDSEMLMMVR